MCVIFFAIVKNLTPTCNGSIEFQKHRKVKFICAFLKKIVKMKLFLEDASNFHFQKFNCIIASVILKVKLNDDGNYIYSF